MGPTPSTSKHRTLETWPTQRPTRNPLPPPAPPPLPKVLNAGCLSYLDLERHPDVIAASKAALDEFGTSITNSRAVCGSCPIHTQVRRRGACGGGVGLAPLGSSSLVGINLLSEWPAIPPAANHEQHAPARCTPLASPPLTPCQHPRRAAQLEAEVADFLAKEAPVLFPSGWTACMAAVKGIARQGDLVLIDAAAHDCLRTGARLSRATVVK